MEVIQHRRDIRCHLAAEKRMVMPVEDNALDGTAVKNVYYARDTYTITFMR